MTLSEKSDDGFLDIEGSWRREYSMEEVDIDDRDSRVRDSYIAFFCATRAPYFRFGNVADLISNFGVKILLNITSSKGEVTRHRSHWRLGTVFVETKDLNNFDGKSLTFSPNDRHWARVRDNETVDTSCKYSMTRFCSRYCILYVHVSCFIMHER